MQRFLVIMAVAIAFYIAGYAMLRWRSVLVWSTSSVHTPEPGVRPGYDHRDTWRGRLKNAMSGPAAYCYAPLCGAETLIRNGLFLRR